MRGARRGTSERALALRPRGEQEVGRCGSVLAGLSCSASSLFLCTMQAFFFVNMSCRFWREFGRRRPAACVRTAVVTRFPSPSVFEACA
jgi:hypothetical protein